MRPAPHTHASPAALKAQDAWLRGQKLGREGRWTDATQHFLKATRLQPHDALYGLNLADAFQKSGHAERALEVATRVFEQEPDNVLAFHLRVNALMTLKRHAALAALLAGAPPSCMIQELYVILGTTQIILGRPQQAIHAYLQALALRPAEAETHYRLGLAFNELTLKQEAAECLRTALLLGMGPMEAGVRDLLAFFERDVCDWRGGDTQVQALRDSIARLPEGAAIQTNPFAHVTLLDDPAEQLRAARSCANFYTQAVNPLPPRRPTPRERLRVGYVTADVRQHATSYLMAELLERHDRSRFEVFIYSHGREDGSPICQRIVAAASHFIRAQDMSPQDMAARIRADGIDILVDLKGYTQDARPALFAYRPAPLQIAYLGFPGTSGAKCIDYIVGDPFVTPLAHEAWFSEKIAQLPGCYQCNDGSRPLPVAPTRASQGLPEGALVLCGFNQAYKISPEVFDVWCRLLHRLPNAVLWLHSWNAQAPDALKREAAARGIDPSRLVFAGSLTQTAHLDRIGCADLFLDTWPCNGHTTTSDMLWAAVPTVTFSGRTFASRVAGSLLHAVGEPELACADVAGYEARVFELATDTPRRLALRERLAAARHSSALFSSAGLAPQLEALYERMWSRALAGLPPEHLPAA